MDRNTKLIRNTLIYTIANFSTTLLSFFLLPLYTVYLTPHDYGEVDLIFTYIQIILPIFTLQITFATVRYLYDSDDFSSHRKILSNACFVLLLGMTLFLIVFGVYWRITGYMYAIYIVFLIVSNGFFSLVQGATRGLKKNSTYALSGVISSAIQILCNISFIVGLGLKSTALLISPTIAYIISSFIIILLTKFHKYISVREINLGTIKTMLKYSIPLVPDAILWWLLLGFGRVFLSRSHGIAAVGIYAVANKFPSVLTMFYSIFNLAWQENAYSEYGKDDRDYYYSKMYNSLMKLIFCTVIILLPGTKIIVPLMLGVAFKTTYLYIPVLYISAMLSMFSTFYGSGFESAKKTNGILISTLVAVIINVGLTLLLTPKLGVFGVALAMAISYMGLFVMRVIRSKQFFTIRVEKKSVMILSLITTVWFGLYYIDNSLLQMFAFFVGCVIFLYVNKIIVKVIFNKLSKGRKVN